MKYLSVKLLLLNMGAVLRRFPLEVVFALGGTIAASVLIEAGNTERITSSWCLRIMMAANLGLLLNLSATLYSESRPPAPGRRILLHLFASGLALTLLFLLHPVTQETDVLRFILLSLAFHLLVSFAAFAGKDAIGQFWSFNKTLFLRFLAGALYSIVLFLGLSAAVASCNFLFNFHFEWNTYAHLWAWIAGIFQTVFVLSGIPSLRSFPSGSAYPKSLKVFTQYVLIPLSSVYLLILLAYEVKILVEWNMPKGLVANLILGYAVFGILSLLLVYPVRYEEENKWIRTYSRSFYILLIPLIILLLLAIIARVRSYGITEERYFLFILAFWLSLITVYFLSSRKENIVLIPVSLCLVALLSVYGPQSAFSVSVRSQINELREIYGSRHALKEGRLQSLHFKADSAGEARIRNIITYMVRFHGLESLQPLYREDLAVVSDSITAAVEKKKKNTAGRTGMWAIRQGQIKWLLSTSGVSEIPVPRSAILQYTLTSSDAGIIPARGADYMVDLANYRDSADLKLDDTRLRISTFPGGHKFVLTIGTEAWTVSAAQFLNGIESKRLEENASYTPTPGVAEMAISTDSLTEEYNFRQYYARVIWTDINYAYEGKKKQVRYANGVLLLKRR